MTLLEIVDKIKALKGLGYIRTLRSGSTGIGYTFETLIGLSETNIPIPDIGGRVEIKTSRKDSNSLVTLFCFNRGVWHLPQKELIKKYGYIDDDGRPALKNTVFFGRETSQGFTLDINDQMNVISVVNKEGVPLGTWDVYILVSKLLSKLSRVLIVLADRKIIDGFECFHYNKAYILTEPSHQNFREAFRNGKAGIDLRMHLKENGTVRNRGTGFRIKEVDLISLYAKRNLLKL